MTDHTTGPPTIPCATPTPHAAHDYDGLRLDGPEHCPGVDPTPTGDTARLDLDAIERRANAATPGPWQALGTNVLAPVQGCNCGGYGPPCYVHESHCGLEPVASTTEADAEFIAGARQWVPALLAWVRQLEDALLAERETHRREHLERLAAERHAHSADKQIAHLTAVVARRDEELARLREREAQRHVEQCDREIAAIETTEEQS